MVFMSLILQDWFVVLVIIIINLYDGLGGSFWIIKWWQKGHEGCGWRRATSPPFSSVFRCYHPVILSIQLHLEFDMQISAPVPAYHSHIRCQFLGSIIIHWVLSPFFPLLLHTNDTGGGALVSIYIIKDGKGRSKGPQGWRCHQVSLPWSVRGKGVDGVDGLRTDLSSLSPSYSLESTQSTFTRGCIRSHSRIEHPELFVRLRSLHTRL